VGYNHVGKSSVIASAFGYTPSEEPQSNIRASEARFFCHRDRLINIWDTKVTTFLSRVAWLLIIHLFYFDAGP
jgi:hypothetical protein